MNAPVVWVLRARIQLRLVRQWIYVLRCLVWFCGPLYLAATCSVLVLPGFFWETTSGFIPVFSAIWFDSGYMCLSVYGGVGLAGCDAPRAVFLRGFQALMRCIMAGMDQQEATRQQRCVRASAWVRWHFFSSAIRVQAAHSSVVPYRSISVRGDVAVPWHHTRPSLFKETLLDVVRLPSHTPVQNAVAAHPRRRFTSHGDPLSVLTIS